MKINLKAHLVKGIDFSRQQVTTYCGLTFTKARLEMQRTEMKSCLNCLRIMVKRAGTTMLHTGML